MIYEQFLPRALAEGKYIAAPGPDVTCVGFGSVEVHLEARKTVIITL